MLAWQCVKTVWFMGDSLLHHTVYIRRSNSLLASLVLLLLFLYVFASVSKQAESECPYTGDGGKHQMW